VARKKGKKKGDGAGGKREASLKLGTNVPETTAKSPLADLEAKKKARNKFYLRELRGLHIQLVKVQEWVRNEGRKLVVVF